MKNNNFANASRFLYISFSSLHDYDVKMTIAPFMKHSGKQATTNFSLILFLNLSAFREK